KRGGGRREPEKKVDVAELQEAQAQVRHAVAAYELKRAEMQGALEKYRKALDNLARLGGGEAAEQLSRWYSAAEANALYRRPATAANVAPPPATVLAPQPAPGVPARRAVEPMYTGAAPQPTPALPTTAAPHAMQAPA